MYYPYWGKAKPSEAGQADFHLLIFHCLDVAAVGRVYLEKSPSLLKPFTDLLNCSESAFLSWSAFFIALHDLGKFSEAFQSQRGDLVKDLKGRPCHSNKIYSERHDSLGFWLWQRLLLDDDILKEIGISNFSSKSNQRAIRYWMQAVTGHHGMPPKPSGTVDFFFCKEDKAAVSDFVRRLASLLLTDEARQIPLTAGDRFEQISQMLSWWFSGVTILADWIGSDTNFFQYHDQPSDLDQYWRAVQKIAGKALQHSGVLRSGTATGKRLTDFFPYIKEASPLQAWAASVDIPVVPQLYLMEDVTGAGKTEAAMILAYRLMAQGLADGFFIGLPTMSTANAMYQRVSDVYRQLFAGDASLSLGHGFKKLVEEFAASVLPADTPENDKAQLDETATARCTAWLADHNKRTLLAPAGVGTVDQVLLAVLHSKHQSLRLLGLFGKVLIIDEVHACDAYMLRVLCIVLQFHARSGGSVILLSATLPNAMKQTLLDAYAVGRNQASAPAVSSSAYPLATRWHDGQPDLLEAPLKSRDNVSRTVQVHYEADPEKIFAHINAALQQGLCVGWIRNTVADAMEAYARLSLNVEPEKITLFHARFALRDRLNKEEQVLACFGNNSTADQRKGRLMIATQVAEQSLDVDFDVLITDLAPIDRVLQRAGRLQRHVRDKYGNRLREKDALDQRAAPCLWVYGPSWTEQPPADWYGAVFKKGQYVYDHHGQLWLSAKVLQKGSFSMPAQGRELIEAVYSDAEMLPDSLLKNASKAQGQEMSEASIAQQNTLNLENGYQRGEIGDWWSEAKTPSRLGAATMDVMLAKWADGKLLRWDAGPWPYSMVKVAAHLLAKAELPSQAAQEAAYLALKQTLPSQGEWCVLLPLSPGADGVWQGQGWTAGNEKKKESPKLLTWLYDADFGLRLQESTDSATTPD
ncbi:CRISPR-associated helicase/endonuclease Cas3 [Janthinobacterium agaricidamnosum]|uniref:CRISPR-associated helicase/endonuclease Cas3 n=1 Tax=Janthinobacterium agaricidamnosum TaxID=55508 RepID=UPI00056FBC90|nr:CRISPR-associated helicase/endonuclease Cas3 [Janthinobacterium agaricidamnosum]